LKSPKDEALLEQSRKQVSELTDRYPLYPNLKY